jgi:hypothetical protein
MERQPTRLDDAVEIYLRDYRLVNSVCPGEEGSPRGQDGASLKDPLVPKEKILIDTVVVNPKLDALLFSKPEIADALNAS